MSAKEILLYILFPLILFSGFLSICFYVIIKQRKQLKYNKVFDRIKNSIPNLVQIYFKFNGHYDIYAETQYSKYYIKIITNTKGKYLHVDPNYDFYLLNKPTDNLLYPLNVQKFLEFNPIDLNKRINKIIVLYPEVIEKVYYESNVKARFIYSDVEIRGAHILNFDEIGQYFKENEI